MADADPDAEVVALTAKADQLEARRREFARGVGSYYAGLLESGIPEGLAGTLTENFHDHHWAFVFGANTASE